MVGPLVQNKASRGKEKIKFQEKVVMIRFQHLNNDQALFRQLYNFEKLVLSLEVYRVVQTTAN